MKLNNSDIRQYCSTEAHEFENYCNSFFDLKTKKLKIQVTLPNTDMIQESFYSCYGAANLIINGFETEAVPQQSKKNQSKLSILSRFFASKGE